MSFEQLESEVYSPSVNERKINPAPSVLMESVINGDLLSLLCELGKMPTFLARCYAKQMAEVVGYLHSAETVHRNLALENFLLDSDFNLRLTGFEHSCQAERDQLFSEEIDGCNYLSPEQNENKPYNGFKVDVFSLGVCIFALVAGRFPFEFAGENDENYTYFINQEEEEFWKKQEEISNTSSSKRQFFSESFKNLINGVFKYDVSQRLSIEAVITHPWLAVSPEVAEKTGGLVREFLKKKVATL